MCVCDVHRKATKFATIPERIIARYDVNDQDGTTMSSSCVLVVSLVVVVALGL